MKLSDEARGVLETCMRQNRVTAEARREVEAMRGRLVKSTGDGLLATFDGPARALRAITSVRDALSPLGLPIRAGLHTGEVDVLGDDVGGIAGHIGARRVNDLDLGAKELRGKLRVAFPQAVCIAPLQDDAAVFGERYLGRTARFAYSHRWSPQV